MIDWYKVALVRMTGQGHPPHRSGSPTTQVGDRCLTVVHFIDLFRLGVILSTPHDNPAITVGAAKGLAIAHPTH